MMLSKEQLKEKKVASTSTPKEVANTVKNADTSTSAKQVYKPRQQVGRRRKRNLRKQRRKRKTSNVGSSRKEHATKEIVVNTSTPKRTRQ